MRQGMRIFVGAVFCLFSLTYHTSSAAICDFEDRIRAETPRYEENINFSQGSGVYFLEYDFDIACIIMNYTEKEIVEINLQGAQRQSVLLSLTENSFAFSEMEEPKISIIYNEIGDTIHRVVFNCKNGKKCNTFSQKTSAGTHWVPLGNTSGNSIKVEVRTNVAVFNIFDSENSSSFFEALMAAYANANEN